MVQRESSLILSNCETKVCCCLGKLNNRENIVDVVICLETVTAAGDELKEDDEAEYLL